MKVLEIYIQKLRFRNYSERTIETYSCYLYKFFQEENIKDPYQVTTKQIESYLLNKSYSSNSQQNQIIGSLKLFAKYVLGKKEIHLSKIERPKREKKLPMVLDAPMLAKKINAIKNLKHRAILVLGLSCGLRISEVVNLKWEDILRPRRQIHIKNAKGKKDRFVHLNDNMIQLLEDYWRGFRSKEFVFNGQSSKQYTSSSIQKLIKLHIHPKASYHCLRHSYATYAHEQGNDIAMLSKSLGHNSIKTTMIYAHISNNSLKNIKQAI